MTKLSIGTTNIDAAEGLRIVVVEDGPYLLYGVAPFTQQFIMADDMNESWYYKRGE